MPYGTKSRETVTRFMRDIIRYLQPHRPKHIVIACNTATALCLPTLKSEFRQLSISGVIEPGARAAAAAGRIESVSGDRRHRYPGNGQLKSVRARDLPPAASGGTDRPCDSAARTDHRRRAGATAIRWCAWR